MLYWNRKDCTSCKQVVAIDGHRIVSVYNRTKEKGHIPNIYQSRVYDTALEAIKDPEVNGVYIATTRHIFLLFNLFRTPNQYCVKTNYWERKGI